MIILPFIFLFQGPRLIKIDMRATGRYTLMVTIICTVGFIYLLLGILNEHISSPFFQRYQDLPPSSSGSFEFDSSLNLTNNIGSELSNISATSDVLILLWSEMHNKYWHRFANETPLPCADTTAGSSPCACRFTRDKTLVNSSSALIWDLVRKEKSFPSIRKPDQYWILLNSEFLRMTNTYFPYKTSNLFNLSAGYHEDTDIHLPYGMCRPRDSQQIIQQNIIVDKKGTCLGLISACNDARSLRLHYIRQLNMSIPVEIIGRCGIRTPKTGGRGFFGTEKSSIKRDLLNNYKFYLSFENTLCKHYITEKVFKVLQDDIQTVPIVRGFGPYKDLLPPHSYIDTADYATTEDLAQYLKLLVSDSELYLKYFKWRETFKCFDFYLDLLYEWPCRICKHICQLRNTREKRNLKTFAMFQTGNNCFFPKDVNDKP